MRHVLNTAGQQAVRAWVADSDKRNVKPDAYFPEAETEMDRAVENGGTPVIEIRAMHSRSGRPETLTLQREWFDAEPDA